MIVRFVAPNPRQAARPLLDQILNHGTDQLAVVCAFLTPGGVEVLRRHAQRLQGSTSFVVIAWAEPTSLAALNELYQIMPGNLYLRLGVQTPIERDVGPSLMHSKVFFARDGQRCWLWTGSHNLTASAALGVNREAAVILEGTVDEEPFQHALNHLNQCKQEAVLFDPRDPPLQPGGGQTLVIHAECDVSLKSCPWFVHLRAATTDYDRAMRPPGAVWMYLYAPRTLRPGSRRPSALAAYSGRLTALNFTEFHPLDRGIAADWQDADFVIEHRAGVFHLAEPTPSVTTPTQGVFRVETQEDPRVVWFTKKPTPTFERVVGETQCAPVDPDLRPFFTSRSISGNNLVHREYREVKPVYRVPRKELGDIEESALAERLNLPPRAEVDITEETSPEDKFAFIYRARYRV